MKKLSKLYFEKRNLEKPPNSNSKSNMALICLPVVSQVEEAPFHADLLLADNSTKHTMSLVNLALRPGPSSCFSLPEVNPMCPSSRSVDDIF